MTAFPRTPRAPRRGERRCDRGLDHLARAPDRAAGRARATPSRRGRARPSGARSTRGARSRVVHPVLERDAAPVRVERGQLGGPPAEHRDPEGLERLGRRGDVEDRLRPGAHDADRGARELGEVGGHVAGARRRARPAADPVHAADARRSRTPGCPHRAATHAVAETVVPASRPAATSGARSRTAALAGPRAGSARRASSASLAPDDDLAPRRPPMAAGTAPRGADRGRLRAERLQVVAAAAAPARRRSSRAPPRARPTRAPRAPPPRSGSASSIGPSVRACTRRGAGGVARARGMTPVRMLARFRGRLVLVVHAR